MKNKAFSSFPNQNPRFELRPENWVSPLKALEIGINIGGTKTHLRSYDSARERRDFILATAERRVRNWHRDAVALLDIAEKFAEGVTVAAIAIGAHGCDNADACNAFPWRGC